MSSHVTTPSREEGRVAEGAQGREVTSRGDVRSGVSEGGGVATALVRSGGLPARRQPVASEGPSSRADTAVPHSTEENGEGG